MIRGKKDFCKDFAVLKDLFGFIYYTHIPSQWIRPVEVFKLLF